jgi:hypothetical protein
MANPTPNLTFADIQNMLDAIAAAGNNPISNSPHATFWRQTGVYAQDYTAFTTGSVPNVGLPIMNTASGQELTSNFFVILTNPNGLQSQGIEQMPGGGPYITDSGYTAIVNGNKMTGQEIIAAMTSWLTNGFPQ